MIAGGLTIGEVSEQTGVGPGTLRVWEQRYGFPEPERTPTGARRYSVADVERIRRVANEREHGLALRAAIARVRKPAGGEASVYACLRRALDGVAPQRLGKRGLLAISRAIEDEALAAAEQPVLLGSFQRERYYRQVEPRWIELARTARLAAVLADFPRPRMIGARPVEVPTGEDAPLRREWALVCDGPGYAAALAAWEVPSHDPVPGDEGRAFETLWTVEPEAVRAAARVFVRNAAAGAPDLLRDAEARLDDVPPARVDTVRQLAALTNRMVGYLAAAVSGSGTGVAAGVGAGSTASQRAAR